MQSRADKVEALTLRMELSDVCHESGVATSELVTDLASVEDWVLNNWEAKVDASKFTEGFVKRHEEKNSDTPCWPCYAGSRAQRPQQSER